MTNGLDSIIATLEQRGAAIERALSALREIGGAHPSASPAKPEASARNGLKRSSAVRKRMQEAQRLRWAKIKAESEPSIPTPPKASKPKRKLSAEGRKRIIAATKKRWALKRAEANAALEQAQAKKANRKKASAKSPKSAKQSPPPKKRQQKPPLPVEIPIEQL